MIDAFIIDQKKRQKNERPRAYAPVQPPPPPPPYQEPRPGSVVIVIDY